MTKRKLNWDQTLVGALHEEPVRLICRDRKGAFSHVCLRETRPGFESVVICDEYGYQGTKQVIKNKDVLQYSVVKVTGQISTQVYYAKESVKRAVRQLNGTGYVTKRFVNDELVDISYTTYNKDNTQHERS